MSITCFAPGKVILSGEHSVVYGHPAVAMAMNLGVSITLKRINGASKLLNESVDHRLWNAMLEVVPPTGVSVHLESTLPMGKGMGSSAALSIALIRAMGELQGKTYSLTQQIELGHRIETHFHGTPSGLDHTVSVLGKGILYQKTSTTPNITPFNIPILNLLAVDSGTQGNTLQMVEQVRNAMSPTQNRIIEHIGSISRDIFQELTGNVSLDALGKLFNKNHQALKNLNLSTPNIDLIVDSALDCGAYGAKISGSGGGGIVLILTENLHNMKDHFSERGFTSYCISPYSNTLETE